MFTNFLVLLSVTMCIVLAALLLSRRQRLPRAGVPLQGLLVGVVAALLLALGVQML